MFEIKKEPRDTTQRCICCFQELFTDEHSFPGDIFDAIRSCFDIEIPDGLRLMKPIICQSCTLQLVDSCEFKALIMDSLAKLPLMEEDEFHPRMRLAEMAPVIKTEPEPFNDEIKTEIECSFDLEGKKECKLEPPE